MQNKNQKLFPVPLAGCLAHNVAFTSPLVGEDARRAGEGLAVIGQTLPNSVPVKGHTAAFTLIELLVVVLIIGILTAVAVPQYQKAVWKSRYATIKNLTKSLADAEGVYYLANGSYTLDISKLDLNMPTPTSSDSNDRYSVFYYPWGFCALEIVENTTADVQCILKDEHLSTDYYDQRFLGYFTYFSHSNRLPGQTTCVSYGPHTALPYMICKSETGLSEPSYTHTNYLRWYY